MLDDCLSRPAVWVSAPAGSGKTTLVATYLEDRNIPCLWYSADSGDGDVATFFYYMGLAVKRAFPRFRKPLPSLTPEYVMGVPVFARRYFEDLFKQLKPPPFAVIIDNYQDVPEDSQFHEIMNIGLSMVPAGITVMALSRNTHPAAYARLLANDRISRIGWEEIRLTEEESGAIVRMKEKRDLSDDAVAFLHRKTHGWVAGLVLLSEGLKSALVSRSALDGFTPKEVFDYFATEIFQKTDPRDQHFLLTTAFLPSMTAKMAETLSGNTTARSILQRLNGKNYFTECHLRDHPVYVYHPLFREFLISRARETLNPEQIDAIQLQAADLLIEKGQVEDGVALLIQAGHWGRLVPLILDQASTLVSRGQNRTVEEWIGKIPDEILEKTPWLLYWKGLCELLSDPQESRSLFEKAFRSFEGQRNEAGILLAWSGAVSTFLFDFNDFKPLDRWIGWLDERARQGIAYPSPQIGASVASGMIGALAWRMTSHPDARTWMNAAIELSEKSPDVDGRMRAWANAAIFLIWMGEFAECGILLERMRKEVQSGPSSPVRQVILRIVEAMRCNSSAELEEEARTAVAEGLEIAKDSGVHIMDILLYLQGAAGALNEGNKDGALDCLDRMRQSIGSHRNANAHLGHYYCLLSWCLLARDPAKALASARESLRLLQQAGIPVSEVLAGLVLVQALERMGRSDEAWIALSAAEGITAGTGSVYLAYLCGLTRAGLLLVNSSPARGAGVDGPPPVSITGEGAVLSDEEALLALRRALALGRTKGFATMIYFWAADTISYLCAKALEAGIEVEYAKDLIRKLRLSPPPSQGPTVEEWPYPVRIYTFGRFEVSVGGKGVTPSGKARKKPLLLLKALVALGGRDAKEERLSDILWPDAEGDAAHNSLKTTLARLRQILGNERALTVHDGRVSIDNRFCWVDRWAFERLCGTAESIAEESADGTAQAELRQIALRLFSLYQGNFLPSDADEPWTVIARERLRSKYLWVISALGRTFSSMGENEEALRCYLRGLEAEPLAEEFYRGLMAAYVALGRPLEAISAYERCRRVLRAELGVTPSEEIEGLRRKIHQTPNSF